MWSSWSCRIIWPCNWNHCSVWLWLMLISPGTQKEFTCVNKWSLSLWSVWWSMMNGRGDHHLFETWWRHIHISTTLIWDLQPRVDALNMNVCVHMRQQPEAGVQSLTQIFESEASHPSWCLLKVTEWYFSVCCPPVVYHQSLLTCYIMWLLSWDD